MEAGGLESYKVGYRLSRKLDYTLALRRKVEDR